LNYSYDNLVPAAAPALAAALEAPVRASPLRVAAMEAQGFSARSGGSTVTLAPPAAAPAAAPGAPAGGAALEAAAPSSQTLVLKGIKLLRHPPAPLSVFINLPKGTPPRLNNAYYVGTLNLFNFDLATGEVMNHDDDHAGHAPAGAEARFDVTGVLQRQRARGQWDGGAISVTIATLGADAPGNVTYVTIDSVALVP